MEQGELLEEKFAEYTQNNFLLFQSESYSSSCIPVGVSFMKFAGLAS